MDASPQYTLHSDTFVANAHVMSTDMGNEQAELKHQKYE
jgi:hypothetical protein